jgi:hypothetical protein
MLQARFEPVHGLCELSRLSGAILQADQLLIFIFYIPKINYDQFQNGSWESPLKKFRRYRIKHIKFSKQIIYIVCYKLINKTMQVQREVTGYIFLKRLTKLQMYHSKLHRNYMLQ